MYQFKGKIRYSETDTNGRLTVPALLNYFQDASTFHSEFLGGGFKRLASRNLAWVLSFWQICIKDMPELSEEVVVSTWPYKTGGFFGQRNFVLDDAKGQRLAYANTIWVLVNTQTGRPARVPEDVLACYPDESPLDMEYCERKIVIPKEFEEKAPIPVLRYFIDTNNHVNNEKYVMIAEEFVPEEFTICELRVEYKKAAVLNDILYPRVTVGEKEVTVVLTDENGTPYATVLFLSR